MFNYALSNIKNFDSFNGGGTYLILFAVDQIPPHIGLVHQKNYFSVSTRGVKRKFPVAIVLDAIKKRSIKTIIVKFEMSSTLNSIDSVFSSWNAIVENQSCLLPIKEVLSSWKDSFNSCSFIFDVLDVLKNEDDLHSIEHINCEKLILNDQIILPKYSQLEINEAIQNYRQLC